MYDYRISVVRRKQQSVYIVFAVVMSGCFTACAFSQLAYKLGYRKYCVTLSFFVIVLVAQQGVVLMCQNNRFSQQYTLLSILSLLLGIIIVTIGVSFRAEVRRARNIQVFDHHILNVLYK